MRIMIFIWNLGTGGAQGQTSLLADRLAESGHDIFVVTMYPGGQYWDWLQARGRVRLQSLLRSRPTGAARVWAGLSLGWRVLQLRRLMPKDQGIVVKSTLDINNLIAWLATRKLPNARLAWWMQMSDTIENWEGTLAYRLCKWVSRSVPLLIVNSNAGLAYYDAEGFCCQRHVVIPNGADTEVFRPDPEGRERVRVQWGVSRSDKLIGLVGRIHPVKGHTTFLRAASALCKQRNDLRFVVVGDGPEPYKGELRRLGTELALDKKVIWAGARSDMPAVYAALDITASASYSEGLSNVIVESMACGVPCVVTDVGDSSWVVGDAGVVVPPDSVEELARGVRVLLELDDAERRRLSTNGRQRIERHFSVRRLCEQTEEVLQSLAETTRGP